MTTSAENNAGPTPGQWEELELAAFLAMAGASRSPGMVGFCRHVLPFAVSTGGSLVIDVRAAILAVILMGSGAINTSERWPARGNAASWVFDELVGKSVGGSALNQDLAVHEFDVGLRVALRLIQDKTTAGLDKHMESVLARARDLAVRTMDGERYSLRHLVFALLERTAEEWGLAGARVADSDLAAFRRRVVEEIARNPEAGEQVEAWRAAVGLTDAASGASQGDGGVEALRQSSDAPLAEGGPEGLRLRRDAPALADKLGRDPFARVLAERLREAWKSQSEDHGAGGPWGATDQTDRAYFVHLDGPWGSGKSTMINFLRAHLTLADQPKAPRDQNKWVIVEFNAWREQRNTPAWWALISQFVNQTPRQLDLKSRLRFWWVWVRWKLAASKTTVWLFLFALLGLAAVGGLSWELVFGKTVNIRSYIDDVAKLKIPNLVTTGSGLVGLVGGVGMVVRTLMFGTSANLAAMEALQGDPYRPVMRMFERLVEVVNRPILVIIDDLDRCEADYVVTLLENIQTMLRRAPISYLVAADRRWLATSFGKRYELFAPTLGEPGRSLGHLFVEKLFQLSTPTPAIAQERLQRFWGYLLAGDATPEPGPASEVRQKAENLVAQLSTQETLSAAIETASDDPPLREALRAAAAIRIASPEVRAAGESRFQAYAPLLDPNPRALKRLVNTIAIRQSLNFVEDRTVSVDALARWCILETRWPLLADQVRGQTEWLEGGAPPEGTGEAMRQLFESDAVQAVLTHPAENGRKARAAITHADLAALFG